MDNNVIECYERYYSLYTMQSGDIDTTLTLSTTAEWLTLMTGTLPNDGILQIRAEANALVKGRTADIVVTSTTNPSRTALLTIYQRGLGDYNENNADSDPLKDYRVGWGFNAFAEYKSLTSLRGKIIDPARLATFDSDTTFHSLQEVVRAREEFNISPVNALLPAPFGFLLTGLLFSLSAIIYSSMFSKNISTHNYTYFFQKLLSFLPACVHVIFFIIYMCKVCTMLFKVSILLSFLLHTSI